MWWENICCTTTSRVALTERVENLMMYWLPYGSFGNKKTRDTDRVFKYASACFFHFCTMRASCSGRAGIPDTGMMNALSHHPQKIGPTDNQLA